MTTQIKNRAIEDGAVTGAKVADGTLTGADIQDGAIGTNDIADNAITTAKVANDAITTAKIAPAARPVFTREYVSPQQTITTAGTLSLTHGLGASPKLIRVTLICTTTEGGYAVNDEVEWGLVGDAVADRGVVIVPNSTTIFVRYANNATVFGLPNKTTGTVLNITNANWRMVVSAWA